MFTYKSKQLPKHTKEYSVEIEWTTIANNKEEAFNELASQIVAPGFRQGKAPKDVSARYINPEKLYERVIRKLLPQIYKEIVEKEKLTPVTSPAVELVEAKDNSPWKLTVKVAEIPPVTLKDYKERLSEAHKKASTKSGETTKSETQNEAKPSEQSKASEARAVAPMSEVFTILLANTECEVPDLLVQEEVNRKLSQLADDVRRVGLTIDQYMSSKNTSIEEIKNQFQKESEEMYKIEFVLAKIAEEEKLLVDQKELETILAGARTEKEKEIAKANIGWYETLLRKQKVIDFLNSL